MRYCILPEYLNTDNIHALTNEQSKNGEAKTVTSTSKGECFTLIIAQNDDTNALFNPFGSVDNAMTELHARSNLLLALYETVYKYYYVNIIYPNGNLFEIPYAIESVNNTNPSVTSKFMVSEFCNIIGNYSNGDNDIQALFQTMVNTVISNNYVKALASNIQNMNALLNMSDTNIKQCVENASFTNNGAYNAGFLTVKGTTVNTGLQAVNAELNQVLINDQTIYASIVLYEVSLAMDMDITPRVASGLTPDTYINWGMAVLSGDSDIPYTLKAVYCISSIARKYYTQPTQENRAIITNAYDAVYALDIPIIPGNPYETFALLQMKLHALLETLLTINAWNTNPNEDLYSDNCVGCAKSILDAMADIAVQNKHLLTENDKQLIAENMTRVYNWISDAISDELSNAIIVHIDELIEFLN